MDSYFIYKSFTPFFFILNFNKIFLSSLLISRTLISVTSHSWLGIWIGLEINLMSFIPLIVENFRIFISEAIIRYFLIQTLTSINLLFFIIIEKIYPWINRITHIILNISLLIKIGAAPFHFWFPKVIRGLRWINCLILSTWQKITPIIAISLCISKPWIIIAIISSAIIGALGGINQSSIRSLIRFSSISHIRWILSRLIIRINMWTIYFSIYSFLNCLIISIFNINNFFFLNQIFNSKINSRIYFRFSINLLSLGGLPPFLGFLPKWLVVIFIRLNNINFIVLVIIVITLVTLRFYINITIRALIINYSKTKWLKTYSTSLINNAIFLLTFLSIFSLIFISFINFRF